MVKFTGYHRVYCQEVLRLTRILVLIAIYGLFLVGLSGCGGGSGGISSMRGGGDPMKPPTEPPTTMPGPRQRMVGQINEIQAIEQSNNSIDDVVVDILRTSTQRPEGLTIPQRVSTTQGSGSTTRVHFSAEYDAAGMLQLTADAVLVTTGQRENISTTDQEAIYDSIEGVPATGWRGVELQSESSTWYHYADLFSDIEDAADTDYLTMGYWLFVRKERSSTSSNYRLFVGAAGSDFVEPQKVVGLTGTATYEGPATGLYMQKQNATAAPVFDYFNAKASLTVDFGDANERGTVSGTVTDGTTLSGGALPEVTLEAADWVPTGNSFYGNTSGNGLTGKWGGKFYSEGATLADHPGSAAGTFGAKSADDLQSIVGAFATYEKSAEP